MLEGGTGQGRPLAGWPQGQLPIHEVCGPHVQFPPQDGDNGFAKGVSVRGFHTGPCCMVGAIWEGQGFLLQTALNILAHLTPEN